MRHAATSYAATAGTKPLVCVLEVVGSERPDMLTFVVQRMLACDRFGIEQLARAWGVEEVGSLAGEIQRICRVVDRLEKSRVRWNTLGTLFGNPVPAPLAVFELVRARSARAKGIVRQQCLAIACRKLDAIVAHEETRNLVHDFVQHDQNDVEVDVHSWFPFHRDPRR